jgi:LmbE family N-acetylglucosaminyl deacetylase
VQGPIRLSLMSEDFDAFARRFGLQKRLLVVAPHPDDESLGCGGLIALSRRAGIEVSVVLVTDGSRSHPDSVEWPTQRLIAQRQRELSKALGILGVETPCYSLALPDARTLDLPAAEVEIASMRLAGLISHLVPDLVVTTWRREPHCDHQFAYRLAHDAVRLSGKPTKLLEYMIWTPRLGLDADWPVPGETHTVKLDIRSVREIKLAAVHAHESQLDDGLDGITDNFGLTAYDLEVMVGGHERYDWDAKD